MCSESFLGANSPMLCCFFNIKKDKIRFSCKIRGQRIKATTANGKCSLSTEVTACLEDQQKSCAYLKMLGRLQRVNKLKKKKKRTQKGIWFRIKYLGRDFNCPSCYTVCSCSGIQFDSQTQHIPGNVTYCSFPLALYRARAEGLEKLDFKVFNPALHLLST